jgi:hypothetical protein
MEPEGEAVHKGNINLKIRDDLSVFTLVGVLYKFDTQPKADLDIFSVNIYHSMDKIISEKKKGIIMGDVNIDLLKFGIMFKQPSTLNI